MDSGRSRRVSPVGLNAIVVGEGKQQANEQKQHKVFVNRLSNAVQHARNSAPIKFLNFIAPHAAANYLLFMLDIFFDSYLSALQQSKSNTSLINTYYGIFLSLHLGAIVYYATASGEEVLTAMAELNQALIDEKIFQEGEVNLLNESRYETGRLVCDTISPLLIGGSALSFYMDQYNFGIGFLWATLGSYLAGTISKILHEQSGYQMLVGENPSIRLKKNHIVIAGVGMVTLTASGIAFAITNHALQRQLQERSSSDPHTFASIIEQGFMIVGLDAIISVARLLAADMKEDLIERRVKALEGEEKRIPGVSFNHSTLFHDVRIPELLKNRQVINQLLAFCNSATFAGLLMSLCNGPRHGSLLKVFGAMVVLVTTLKGSAVLYTKDLNAIAERVREPKKRIALEEPQQPRAQAPRV